MAKILERIQRDLAYTMESPNGFGKPIRLISPYGQKQILYGQVSKVQVQTNVSVINQTNLQGDQEIIFKPAVCLRLSSLNYIPQNGEIWVVQTLIEQATNPVSYEVTDTYVTEGNPILDGNIGTITLSLTDTKNQAVLSVDPFEINTEFSNISII